jgi:hypothetical protein
VIAKPAASSAAELIRNPVDRRSIDWPSTRWCCTAALAALWATVLVLIRNAYALHQKNKSYQSNNRPHLPAFQQSGKHSPLCGKIISSGAAMRIFGIQI